MLRTRSNVRPLSPRDSDEALALCARNPVRNVFVASRILESAHHGLASEALGFHEDGRLESLCWVTANVVPVETTAAARAAFADRLHRRRSRTASLLGPRDEVRNLWHRLEPYWGQPRTVRDRQPLLVMDVPPSRLGVEIDELVRPAQLDELDLVQPAAEHMFTAEIGYPPYSGPDRGYRANLASLLTRGRTYVLIERGRVIFKADVGSLALGCAQLQGVWLDPSLRGQGRSAALIASVVEQVMLEGVDQVSLYVNHYNEPARAAYARVGFVQVGEFSTVLL